MYIWTIYTTLNTSFIIHIWITILFNKTMNKVADIYVRTTIPNINNCLVIQYKINPFYYIILWEFVWSNSRISRPEIDIIDKDHLKSIIVTHWFLWIREVVLETSDTFISMMNIRKIFPTLLVSITI